MRCLLILALLLTAALSPLVSSAHGSERLTSLEMVGRYSDLKRAAEQKLAEQPQAGTSVLAPLCLAYSRLKDYRNLWRCLERLEAKVEAGDTTIVTDRADISNSDASPFARMLRAEALIELGDYAPAITAAKEAQSRIQERMPFGVWPAKIYRRTLLGTLGLAYALAGDRTNALAQIKALDEFPIGFIGWGSMPSEINNSIARIYAALGDYAQALRYLKDEGLIIKFAFALNDAAWGFSGSDSRETTLLLPKILFRGKCLLETGDLDGARRQLDTVLHHARIEDFGDLHWVALFERGRISEKTDKPDEAEKFYRKAVDIIERQRASINSETNKIGYVGDKQQVYARLVATLLKQNRSAEAFDYVERSKSRALVDLLAGKTDFATPEHSASQLRTALTQLDTSEQAARTDPHNETRGATRRAIEQLQQEIRASAPELATLVSVSAVPLAELQSLLGHNEVLVEYYHQDQDLYAFILKQNHLSVFRLNADGLDTEVRALRSAIEQQSETWNTPARALHARLWHPLAAMLASAKNVVLVPHGILHYLPFTTLQDTDGTLLIERHALRLLPSASVLKFIRPSQRGRASTLLALGNPDLGERRFDLQFAEDEARAVAALFPNARLLLRDAASKSNFKDSATRFNRLHFATHGKFNAQTPLASGLYLAKGTDKDGILSVGELYTLRLDADLITLSACETGLGKITNGDDVVGLSRGFLYAGGRAIVASLWSIDDKASAELMLAFYKNQASMSKMEALRQAQNNSRHNTRHPFFWAAFTLTGNGE